MGVLLVLFSFLSLAVPDGAVNIMFWNVENLFDYKNDGKNASDAEFSADGTRRWNKGRFWKKISGISKTIAMTGDYFDGEVPDILGFAEVENRYVVTMAVKSALLRKIPFEVVHFESPDSRGIDVALAYRKDRFEMLDAKAFPVRGAGGKMRTRDILSVSLRHLSSGRLFHFIVNHHPSKYGGAEKSAKARENAMKVLDSLCDSLRYNVGGEIVAMGDFNDVPNSPVFGLLSDYMCNLALPLVRKGEGSIRYDGEWNLIDMFFVSETIAAKAVMSVFYAPCLLVPDASHSGVKPFRTYTGPAYSGGISDHLPVLLRLEGI